MDHYILRVYRFGKKDGRKLVGTIERVGVPGKMAFTDYEELWSVIASRTRPTGRRARRRQGEGGGSWKET